jgi:hypothetical protein
MSSGFDRAPPRRLFASALAETKSDADETSPFERASSGLKLAAEGRQKTRCADAPCASSWKDQTL